MSNYGIPYMGSKASICENVCRLFPKADHFYDLFGGGFSITHFMLKHRSKDFKQFHFNELRTGIPDLIKSAIAGKYSYKNYSPPWISREDFFRLKEVDPMIKIIWSFGNNGEDYLFGKSNEQQKKSMHMAVVFNEFDDYAKEVFGMEKFRDGFSIIDKRIFLRSRVRLLHKEKSRGEREQYSQLQQLERLQQLQQLEQLERINFYNTSYENVPIKENAIIYCDIPYGGTAEYDNSAKYFNRKKFFDWANDQLSPVFISEYNVEDDRFTCIGNFKKRSLLSSNKENCLVKTEKVFVNKVGYVKLLSRGNNG